MNTLEMKKNTVKTLNELLDFNSKVNESIESIIDDYINFIEKNVPSGYENCFGVGVAASHSQFGSNYGFESENEYGEISYRCTGNGYYIANDFNCWVKGSNFEQMKEFASKIPEFVKNGMEKLQSDTDEAKDVAVKLKDLF